MMERRREQREAMKSVAFFCQDGTVSKIKLRDTTVSGVGVYTARSFKAGLQGLLLAPQPETGRVQELPIEVCWCITDPLAEDSIFPYRMGLRLLANCSL